MKTTAQYIADAKRVLNDPRMSDRALGEHLGYAQQTIAQAKAGKMSDAVALAVGELLAKHKVIEHAAEVVIVAHAQRDADPKIRASLMDYMGKVLSRLPAQAVNALGALMVAGGLVLQPVPAEAGVGGVGRSRQRR